MEPTPAEVDELAPARSVTDADGVRHLVALTDEVEGWVVIADGRPLRRDQFGFRNDPTGRYAGLPSWHVEGIHDWKLYIDGTAVRADRGPIVPATVTESAEGNEGWAVPHITTLADTWFGHDGRPRLAQEGARQWSAVVEWWIADSNHPLPVRSRSTGRRGSVEQIGDREVLFVDNSPAQWVFARAVIEGWMPSTADLDAVLRSREMPVAQILTRNERERAAWTTTLARVPSTGALGWRLHHIDPVATGRALSTWTSGDVEGHARKLLDPSNMFVLPAQLKGLGEIPAFIDRMRELAKRQPR